MGLARSRKFAELSNETAGEHHTTMSKQAIASERVREGLKDVLLGPAQLYEALREKAGEQGVQSG
jgi:hypothetical protein